MTDRPPANGVDRAARLARLNRMANALDTRFRIPGLGLPVGWDSILGLIPGLGDLVTVGPGVYMIYEGHRLGARKRVLARLGLNTAIDTVVGGIPLLGDAFDLVFKSHRRNLALLKRELGKNPQITEDTTWQSANDPATAPGTPTASRAQKAPPTRRAVPAGIYNATSPRGTS